MPLPRSPIHCQEWGFGNGMGNGANLHKTWLFTVLFPTIHNYIYKLFFLRIKINKQCSVIKQNEIKYIEKHGKAMVLSNGLPYYG